MYQKIIIILLFLLFLLFGSFAYIEGFNDKHPEKKYIPYTDVPIPTAIDGTPYLSPYSNGNCPEGMVRNMNDPDSLCNRECKQGEFYKVDDIMYGCLSLNKDYLQINHPTYVLADDEKTYFVSPTVDAVCPKLFNLDTTSGLCHTKCGENEKFYGKLGCISLNTKYPQSKYYDLSKNPLPYAEDNTTQFTSPTSNAECLKGFILDYSSGLCHTKCRPNKKFNGQESGTSILGCI